MMHIRFGARSKAPCGRLSCKIIRNPIQKLPRDRKIAESYIKSGMDPNALKWTKAGKYRYDLRLRRNVPTPPTSGTYDLYDYIVVPKKPFEAEVVVDLAGNAEITKCPKIPELVGCKPLLNMCLGSFLRAAKDRKAVVLPDGYAIINTTWNWTTEQNQDEYLVLA